jgi:hypothetical protein
MAKNYEFHFQEGFAGETVTVAVDGQTRVSFKARTRLQTGLARIESLQLDPGQTVAIAVPELALHQTYRVAEGDRWITINLVGGALVVRPAQASPGYL